MTNCTPLPMTPSPKPDTEVLNFKFKAITWNTGDERVGKRDLTDMWNIARADSNYADYDFYVVATQEHNFSSVGNNGGSEAITGSGFPRIKVVQSGASTVCTRQFRIQVFSNPNSNILVEAVGETVVSIQKKVIYTTKGACLLKLRITDKVSGACKYIIVSSIHIPCEGAKSENEKKARKQSEKGLTIQKEAFEKILSGANKLDLDTWDEAIQGPRVEKSSTSIFLLMDGNGRTACIPQSIVGRMRNYVIGITEEQFDTQFGADYDKFIYDLMNGEGGESEAQIILRKSMPIEYFAKTFNGDIAEDQLFDLAALSKKCSVRRPTDDIELFRYMRLADSTRYNIHHMRSLKYSVNEAGIGFPCTYRVEPGNCAMYAQVVDDTIRAPAWTDRIMEVVYDAKTAFKINNYNSLPVRGSDHVPVVANIEYTGDGTEKKRELIHHTSGSSRKVIGTATKLGKSRFFVHFPEEKRINYYESEGDYYAGKDEKRYIDLSKKYDVQKIAYDELHITATEDNGADRVFELSFESIQSRDRFLQNLPEPSGNDMRRRRLATVARLLRAEAHARLM